MYADTNTLPYRELFALARHTVLFTNGLGNWWYISNISSHRLAPWMFLTSGEGNPVAFKNRANTLLLPHCSTLRPHRCSCPIRCLNVILFPSHARPSEKPRGVLTNSHRQRGVLYTGRKREGPLMSVRDPPSIAGIYDLLAFPLPFEHYSSQRSMIQGNYSYNEASPEGFWVLNKGPCW